jgi:Holliday junction resolvase RusA-like endonuclease
MVDKKVTFTVPGEPQGKGRPRATIRAGHAATYTPEKTRSYEGVIAVAAQGAMRGRQPFAGACAVDLDILVSVPASWSQRKRAQALNGVLWPTKKPDVDNVEKAIFDAMNGIVWRDDVQVVDVVKRKRYAETPGVRVVVAEIGGAMTAAGIFRPWGAR